MPLPARSNVWKRAAAAAAGICTPLLPRRSAPWRSGTRRLPRRRRSRRRGASGGAARARAPPRRPRSTWRRSRRCGGGGLVGSPVEAPLLHGRNRSEAGKGGSGGAVAGAPGFAAGSWAAKGSRFLAPSSCCHAVMRCPPARPAGDVPGLQGRAARLPAQGRQVAHLAVVQRPQRHPGGPDGGGPPAPWLRPGGGGRVQGPRQGRRERRRGARAPRRAPLGCCQAARRAHVRCLRGVQLPTASLHGRRLLAPCRAWARRCRRSASCATCATRATSTGAVGPRGGGEGPPNLAPPRTVGRCSVRRPAGPSHQHLASSSAPPARSPYMILGPLSTLTNWVNEFERWAPGFPCVLYHGSKQERQAIRAKRMPTGARPPPRLAGWLARSLARSRASPGALIHGCRVTRGLLPAQPGRGSPARHPARVTALPCMCTPSNLPQARWTTSSLWWSPGAARPAGGQAGGSTFAETPAARLGWAGLG